MTKTIKKQRFFTILTTKINFTTWRLWKYMKTSVDMKTSVYIADETVATCTLLHTFQQRGNWK